jgi:hypothetical protein
MSKNLFRDIIIFSLEMSRRSNVPVLFISNPGYGKTTTINTYAAKNGYHVESVIGSQYSKDEILGYLVNEGGESLTAKAPEWYINIIKNKEKNIPSILFFDEITAASTEVQSSLLQVCFERKIRGGRLLPEDCIICAAANYKLNLPGWCDIMAPQINRFCIINLQPENDFDIIEEFTQNIFENDADWPSFENLDQSLMERKILTLTRKFLNGLWKKYPRDLSTKVGQTIGALNLRNQCLDGMYSDNDDGTSQVLNFISGRNISYTARLLLALYSMGVNGNDPTFISLVMDGIMGGGTNSWSDDPEEKMRQINSFRDIIHTKACEILKKCNNNDTIAKSNSVIYSSDLQGKIIETMNSYESGDIDDIDENLHEINDLVSKKYSTQISNSLSFLDGTDEKLGEFTSDYEAIMRLYEFLKENYEGSENTKDVYNNIKTVLKTYTIYYQEPYVE